MKITAEIASRIKQLTASYKIETSEVIIPPEELAKIIEGRSCALLAKELHKSGVLYHGREVEQGIDTYLTTVNVVSAHDLLWIMRQVRELEIKGNQK